MGDGDDASFPGGPDSLEELDSADVGILHDSFDYKTIFHRCDWHLHLLEFQSDQVDHRWLIENVLRRGKVVGAGLSTRTV